MDLVANLEAELYRVRRDRRLLLANLLTSLAARGWTDSDLDRINADYILWCATSGTRVDIEAALAAQPTAATRGEADFVTAATVVLVSQEPSGPPPARLAPAFPVPPRALADAPPPPRLPPEPSYTRQAPELSSATYASAAVSSFGAAAPSFGAAHSSVAPPSRGAPPSSAAAPPSVAPPASHAAPSHAPPAFRAAPHSSAHSSALPPASTADHGSVYVARTRYPDSAAAAAAAAVAGSAATAAARDPARTPTRSAAATATGETAASAAREPSAAATETGETAASAAREPSAAATETGETAASAAREPSAAATETGQTTASAAREPVRAAAGEAAAGTAAEKQAGTAAGHASFTRPQTTPQAAAQAESQHQLRIESILAPPRPLFPLSPPAEHHTPVSPPPLKPKAPQLAKKLFATPSAASPVGYSTGSDGTGVMDWGGWGAAGASGMRAAVGESGPGEGGESEGGEGGGERRGTELGGGDSPPVRSFGGLTNESELRWGSSGGREGAGESVVVTAAESESPSVFKAYSSSASSVHSMYALSQGFKGTPERGEGAGVAGKPAAVDAGETSESTRKSSAASSVHSMYAHSQGFKGTPEGGEAAAYAGKSAAAAEAAAAAAAAGSTVQTAVWEAKLASSQGKSSPVQPSSMPSPVQPSPVQTSPVQTSPIQPSPIQPSSVQPSPVQPSPVQPSPVQPSPIQASPVEPLPIQPSPVQPSTLSVDPFSPEPSSVVFSSPEYSSVKPSFSELSSANPPSVEPSLVEPSLVEPSLVEPASVKPSSVKPPSEAPSPSSSVELSSFETPSVKPFPDNPSPVEPYVTPSHAPCRPVSPLEDPNPVGTPSQDSPTIPRKQYFANSRFRIQPPLQPAFSQATSEVPQKQQALRLMQPAGYLTTPDSSTAGEGNRSLDSVVSSALHSAGGFDSRGSPPPAATPVLPSSSESSEESDSSSALVWTPAPPVHALSPLYPTGASGSPASVQSAASVRSAASVQSGSGVRSAGAVAAMAALGAAALGGVTSAVVRPPAVTPATVTRAIAAPGSAASIASTASASASAAAAASRPTAAAASAARRGTAHAGIGGTNNHHHHHQLSESPAASLASDCSSQPHSCNHGNGYGYECNNHGYGTSGVSVASSGGNSGANTVSVASSGPAYGNGLDSVARTGGMGGDGSAARGAVGTAASGAVGTAASGAVGTAASGAVGTAASGAVGTAASGAVGNAASGARYDDSSTAGSSGASAGGGYGVPPDTVESRRGAAAAAAAAGRVSSAAAAAAAADTPGDSTYASSSAGMGTGVSVRRGYGNTPPATVESRRGEADGRSSSAGFTAAEGIATPAAASAAAAAAAAGLAAGVTSRGYSVSPSATPAAAAASKADVTPPIPTRLNFQTPSGVSGTQRSEGTPRSEDTLISGGGGVENSVGKGSALGSAWRTGGTNRKLPPGAGEARSDVEGGDDDEDDDVASIDSSSCSDSSASEMSATLVAGGDADGGTDQWDGASSAGRLKWPLRQLASGLTVDELKASAYEVLLLAAAESGSIAAPVPTTATSDKNARKGAAGKPESPSESKPKSPGGFMSRFAKKVAQFKSTNPAAGAAAASGVGKRAALEGGSALPPELIRMQQQLGIPQSLHSLLLSAVFLPPPSHTVEMFSPLSPLNASAAAAAAAAVPPLPLPLCLLLHLSPIPSALSSSFSPGVGHLKLAAASLAASFSSLPPDLRRAFFLRQVKLLQELLLDLSAMKQQQGHGKGKVGGGGGGGGGDECAEVAACLDAMLALVKGHEFITSPPSFEAKWSRKLSELRWLLVGGFNWGGRRGNSGSNGGSSGGSGGGSGSKQQPVLPGAWCPSRSALNVSLYRHLLSACCGEPSDSDSASFNDLLFELEERVEALRSTWQPLGVTPVTYSAMQAWTLCCKASVPTLPPPSHSPLSPSPATSLPAQQQLLPIRAVLPLICQSLRRLPPTACARPSSAAAAAVPGENKDEASAKVPLRPFVQSVSRFLSSLLSDYHHTLLEASSASGAAKGVGMSADGLAALESALDSYLCCCDLLEAGRRKSHRHTTPGMLSTERAEAVLEFVHMSVLSSFDRACLDAMSAAAAAQAQEHGDGSSSFSFRDGLDGSSSSPSSSASPGARRNTGPAAATSRDFRAAGANGEVGLAQMAELASVIIEREAGGMAGKGEAGGGKRGGRGGEKGALNGGCCAVFRRLGVYGTAAVAAAALHQQLDSQLDPFLSVVSELHPDFCKVFSAVDAFDQRVQQVVQGEVRAEEEHAEQQGLAGAYGHAAQIASELSPYQIDPVMNRLFTAWVSSQQQKLTLWMERGVEAETFEPASDSLKHCASAVDAVRLVEEVFDQFFRLGLPPRLPMLQQMVVSADTLLCAYVSRISTLGPKDELKVPPPPLTRFKEDMAERLAGKAERRAEREERVQKGKAGYLEGLWHARKGGAGGGGGGGGGKVGVRAGDAAKAAAIDALSVGKLCVRINTLEFVTTELDKSEKGLCERWDKYAPHLKIDDMADLAPSQMTSSLAFRLSTEGVAGLKRGSFFEHTSSLAAQRMQTLSDYLGTKVVWWDLREAFLEELYRVSVDSWRMSHLMQRLDPVLGEIVQTVSDSLRDRVVTSLLHSVLEGLLRVLLDGGALRVFAQSDYDALEDDLRILKEFFVANGNGLPQDLVNKAAAPVQQVLNYYSLDTADVITAYKQAAGSSQAPGGAFRVSSFVKGRAGLTANDAHVLLRVLCHRADRDASKFLKKHMHLPKSY